VTRRRRVLWIAGAAALVGLAAWALRPAADQQFRDYVVQLRAAGTPTTLLELYGADAPDDENAAPEITAALRWLDDEVGPDRDWTVVGPWRRDASIDDERPWFERASPDELHDLAGFLDRVRPFFDRVAAALERPRCRFPLRVDAFGFPDSAGVSSIQRLTRVVGARAFADPASATRVEGCRELLLVARRFEPLLPIGPMVQAAAATLAATALRHGVEIGVVDAATARAAVDPLLAPTWLDVGRSVAVVDMVQTLSNFQAALDFRGEAPANERPADAFMTDLMTRMKDAPREVMVRQCESIVGYCEDLREASELPTRPFSAYLRRSRAMVAAAREPRSAIVIPSAAERAGRTEAACRLARVALAVAERRSVDGEFPASLDALRPMFADGVPLDPFTDAPFVYERTPTGVRIESAGRLAEDAALDEPMLRERCLVWELKR
jgi:hypothetical protein